MATHIIHQKNKYTLLLTTEAQQLFTKKVCDRNMLENIIQKKSNLMKSKTIHDNLFNLVIENNKRTPAINDKMDNFGQSS